MKNTDNSAEIKYKIDSEINLLMRKLNSEMESAKRKWKFHGLATPIVMLAGSLSLFSSGMDSSQMISTLLGSGAVVQGLKTWSDMKSEKDKASLNPAYFLWKARR